MSSKRAIDQMRKSTSIRVPWEVWRILSGHDAPIRFFEDTASLAKDGDYAPLHEIRPALAWMAEQFGGKISWSDD